jgi:hypothetical protein
LREEKMKTKHVALMILAMMMLSGTLLATVKATATWPKVPSATVQLTVVNGIDSYFISTLSGVPAGFDVYDGIYPGWCVDRSVTMVRGVSHDVKLYSSISPPVLTGIPWIAVNYILNHKQGTMMDIQNAIWHFTDNYTPSGGNTPAAQAMIDEADAHPNYDPLTGEILAIICVPLNHIGAQDSIIELQKPGGKVTGGGQCIVGDNDEIPSASFGFNAMWFSRNPTPNGEINYVDHITGQHVHVHDLTYLVVWFDEPENKPWPMLKAKFGGLDVYSGLMVDVYVEDHGEPGKNDIFYIKLHGVYLGGSLVDPILAGNIQIHKPPK